MQTWIESIVNRFAISDHTALIFGVHALRSYLKLICEYELHSLPNTKVNAAKDHGKNYMKIRPPLVRHLLRNRLLLKQAINDVDLFLDFTQSNVNFEASFVGIGQVLIEI